MVGFAYDPRGGLASVTNMWSVNPTASVSYGYDPAGRLQTLTQALAGTSADQVWGFTYNPAGQIVTRAGSNDAYGSNTAYAVDRGYTVNGLNQYETAGPATLPGVSPPVPPSVIGLLMTPVPPSAALLPSAIVPVPDVVPLKLVVPPARSLRPCPTIRSAGCGR